MFQILSVCKGGGYRYCRTEPPHPRRNSNGLYPLHRVLAENRLGRLLEPGEVVHHADHDKSNDTPENLEVLQNHEHSRHHITPGRMMSITCHCGTAFDVLEREARKRLARAKSGVLSCSRSCGGAVGHATRPR
jgi:hypothetical protein